MVLSEFKHLATTLCELLVWHWHNLINNTKLMNGKALRNHLLNNVSVISFAITAVTSLKIPNINYLKQFVLRISTWVLITIKRYFMSSLTLKSQYSTQMSSFCLCFRFREHLIDVCHVTVKNKRIPLIR